jgi:hypothetical protein
MNKSRLMAVGIESNPPKARVFADNGQESVCVTPCEYKITKGGKHRLEIRWRENPPQTVEVKRSIHPGFWFNFFFGPGVIIAMPIDALTGAMFRPSHKAILAQFDPNLSPEEEEEDDEPAPQGFQRLPDTPELRRIKEQFPEEYMRAQVELYYGAQKSDEDYFRLIDRLYLIMINMYRADERLDADEAVRRDHFLNPQKPRQ